MKSIVDTIPSYKAFYRGEHTLDIGYPWLTFGAIMALEKILSDNPEMKILEMGSGGSTVFFANRCKKLYSMEHDIKWYERVKDQLDKNGIQNVSLHCGSISLIKTRIELCQDEEFDMILADGGSSYRERKMLMDASIPKLKRGGWLIIDNYLLCPFDYATGWDVYTFDMFRYSGRGTRLLKKL